MRLAPNTDTVPARVNKYLLPRERQVISVHQHPAVLIRPITEVLIGLAVAGWVSSSIAHGNNTAILVIWIFWALLLPRLVWKVFDWSENYFVITSQRLLLSHGFLIRKVNMMPLTKVTDMSFQRSAMGLLLGYGEFIVESASQDQALRNVDHLPHPGLPGQASELGALWPGVASWFPPATTGHPAGWRAAGGAVASG